MPQHTIGTPSYLPGDLAAAPGLDAPSARYDAMLDARLDAPHPLYRPAAPAQQPTAPEPKAVPAEAEAKRADPPAAKAAAAKGNGADGKEKDKTKEKDKDDKVAQKGKAGGGAGAAATLDGELATTGLADAGGGGSARGEDLRLEKREPTGTLPPIRAPTTGSHHLARPSFGVRLSPTGFGETRELGVRPAASAQRAGANAPEAREPVLDYRSLYADAVERTRDLHRRLNDEALRIVGDADRRDRELAALHQSALDASLLSLDGALMDGRTRLASGSEQLRTQLDATAARMRRRIVSAAGGAIGALEARLKQFEGRLNPMERRRRGILRQAWGGTSAVVRAGNAAIAELGRFAANAESRLPKTYSVMQLAIQEAQVAYAPGYAELDQKAIEERRDKLEEYLTDSFKCLDCDFDRAFQSLRGQCDTMRVAGPKAVLAAQDGALKAVDNAVDSMRKAIDANEDATKRGLVAQHERARESLVASAQANTAQEAESLAQSAERQGEALTAMAEGQPRAVRQVRDMIAAQAGLAAPQFGQAVSRASARLRDNIAGIAARQPGATAENAARLAAGQLARARQFEGRQRAIVHGADLGLEQVVEQALAQIDKQIAETFAGMDNVPADVRASCNAYLAPAGPALDDAIQSLGDAIGAVGARVHQILNGGDAMAKHDAAVKKRKSEQPPPPKDTAGDKQGAGRKQGQGKAPPAPAAEPSSCGGACADQGGKEKKEEKKADEAAAAKPDGAKDGAGGQADGAEQAEPGDDTPNGFKAMCERIKADPTTAPQIAAFLKRAAKEVPDKLGKKVQGINTALATTFAPDTDALMANLRGLTRRQGSAISYLYWRLNPSTTLEDRIWKKYFKDSKLSSSDTDQANYDAAIGALRGRDIDAAMSELVAAFNYSNENQRIRDVLLSLTPQQITELNDKHGDKLKELAEQLDGEDKRIFLQLLANNPAPAKANALLQGIDKINEEQRGQKRGDEIAKKLTEARTDFSNAIEGDPARRTADIFGFEAQTDAVKKRKEEHWSKVQTEFAQLEPVKAAVGKHADPKAAILDYATRKVSHEDNVSYGDYPATVTTYDTVNDYHKEWLRQILDKGPDSVEAKGARLLVEERRDKADLTGLDAAIHSGAGDAREGGGYDKKARDKGKEEAKEERKKILEASEAARARIEKTKPGDAESAQKRLKESFAKKLSADEAGQRVAEGMLDSDEGNPAAVMDYALKHEKSELALMQLKRMDRREIHDFVTDYNNKNKDKPGLHERLGVFSHHGSGVFDGDEANELTIAFMGVPQNDKERGEVALKTMNLTIDQSGALGRGLANEEYQALLANARRLKDAMGVTNAEIDEYGFIRATDRDGNKIVTNFDAKGNLIPKIGGDTSAFETAVAMAKVSSSAYTQATDRIANFITTALMVIAAVVTTVLTGGAAASIWIPVLVTAGAGLVGMALTASIKGDRYTRDEMIRDLAMTIVQAATAGIGAAVGAGLRGGTGAVKALASSMRVSEQALAKAAGQQAMLRGLTLAEEMAIGAGSSALSGGVAAAVDPAARKGDDYGMGIFHGMLRGAIGGAAGAGVTRGVSQGIGNLAKGAGAKTGASAVLAREGSVKAASRVAAMRAKAFSTSALTEIGTRSLASGLSGAATRAVDLGYNATVLNQKIGAGQFFEEVGWAFVQNAIQGAAEGAGDRTMRGLSKGRAAEHAFTIQGQDLEFKQLGLEAMVKEGRRRGLIPPAPAPDPEAPKGSAARSGAQAADEKGPAAKPDGAPADELPAIVKLPKQNDNEEEALAGLAKLADPEGEPAPPAPPKLKTSEDQHVPNSLDDSGTGNARSLLTPANDNKRKYTPKGGEPLYESMDLSKTDMVKLGPIPEGSVFIHPDPTNVMAANDNFGRMILADPGREVAHLYNPVTGESLVVQGHPDTVATIMADGRITTPEVEAGGRVYGWCKLVNGKSGIGHWELRSHYHPNLTGKSKMPLSGKLPSGLGGDFGILIREARDFTLTKRSSRIYYIDEGKLQYTDFGVNLSGKGPKYWIDIPNPWPWGGTHMRKPFKSMKHYHKYVARKVRYRYPLPSDYQEPAGGLPTSKAIGAGMVTPPARPRALESGSAHQKMAIEDISDVHMLHDIVVAGEIQDAHETVRQMGLVGEPDSMARLNLALNERALPLEVRQSLADTVFAATRDHMVANGKLDQGEELHMFFHGAPQKRTQSLKEGGIDLGKVQGGSDDDFGQAFYLTSGKKIGEDFTGLENAELYSSHAIPKYGDAGKGRGTEPGEVFAFFVRGSKLGTVVDVSKGGKHRPAWEKFLDGPLAYPSFGAHIWKSTRQFLVQGGIKNRGDAFDAFLKSPAFVAEFGPAVARPNLVIGTLGEAGLTGGIGRGAQAALRVNATELAALMSEQVGFRTPAAPANDDDGAAGDAHMLTPPNKTRRGKTPATTQDDAAPSVPSVPPGPKKRRVKQAEVDPALSPAEKPVKPRKPRAKPAEDPAEEKPVVKPVTDVTDEAADDRKQGHRELDPERGRIAAEELEKAQQAAVDARNAKKQAEYLRGLDKKKVLDRFLAKRPEKDAEGERIAKKAMTEQSEWKERIKLLNAALADPELGPVARRYVEWLKEVWDFNRRLDWADEKIDLGDSFVYARAYDADVTQALAVKAAEVEAREANLALKERMRREGPNYRKMKATATRDEVMDQAEFERRQALARAEIPPRKLGISPDHLVSLDEIANMPELSPIFGIYAKAPRSMRAEIEAELKALGDVKDNLVPMWSAPNSSLKRNKSWRDIPPEAAKRFGYTKENIKDILKREEAMRAHIKQEIVKIIKKYQDRLAIGRIVDKSPVLEFAEEDEEQP